MQSRPPFPDLTRHSHESFGVRATGKALASWTSPQGDGRRLLASGSKGAGSARAASSPVASGPRGRGSPPADSAAAGLRASLRAGLVSSLLLALATPPPISVPAADIERIIPPSGRELPLDERARLAAALEEFGQRAAELPQAAREHALLPDALVHARAVELLLRGDELYSPDDLGHAHALLETARARLDALSRGETPWATRRGLVVRGYRSVIDDSIQPYGLVIPEDLDLARHAPLYVWLHGRGDKTLELQFIRERESHRGQISPAGAIVLHPFGRYCNGFKSAGETDVFEALEHVEAHYAIDPDRVVLMGFSMGGAGAWHLGARHARLWAAVSPGAGFAETARYNRLDPAGYPPDYEQRLWALHDAPGYVRNLFNIPVVAYSGEVDRQIQAARVMEEAYRANGRELVHIIGPGMGHQYHPDSLAEILRRVGEAVAAGRPRSPQKVTLEAPTLRGTRYAWVEMRGLAEHWADSRIDAEAPVNGPIVLSTRNVTRLAIGPDVPGGLAPGREVRVDGVVLKLPESPGSAPIELERAHDKEATVGSGAWHVASRDPGASSGRGLLKESGLEGPIDDVFYGPFLVATPEASCRSPAVDAWARLELAHFRDRWRRLFRGDLREKPASAVTAEDLARYSVIVWGDAEANALLARALAGLPLEWSESALKLAGESFDPASHVPVLIYPNPLSPRRYLVLNSGVTFREEHDRTNSQQNPKLPDWAILDITAPPDGRRAGEVKAAGFFDEQWGAAGPRR